MAHQSWSIPTQWRAADPFRLCGSEYGTGRGSASANNASDFSAGISISDSAQEIVDHSDVIASSGIAPDAVHATGVCHRSGADI